ncbi:MAG TPA: ABC transporter permease [Candidatus Binatia bacterium]|nr:ABC transporter permease [Candidatus Binatia bacterium]
MTATIEAGVPGAASPAPRSLSSFSHYRHLTLELAISQFKLRYTQSALGYLWSLLKPAMMFGITYFIFVDLFQINDNTRFYGIQLLLGIVIWTFFSECTAASMQAVAGAGGLIRKAYFPRSILVLAASLTSLFTFLINLVLVIVIALALRQIVIGPQMLVAIPLLLELYLLVLGISFFLASLQVQFRDVGHLWEVLMQLLFYGSGVMFSLTYVLQRANLAVKPSVVSLRGTAVTLHFVWVVALVAANPIMQIIEDLRHALINPQAPWTILVVTGHDAAVKQLHPLNAPWVAPIPYVIVIAVLTLGALIFRARARNFAQDL